MADLWPAFLLGLIGSLHCAGMCGPLALAIPATGASRLSFVAGRASNNLGRVATYSALGALFGLVGMTFALAGVQRWASIVAGSAILAGLFASSRLAINSPMFKAIGFLRARLSGLLRRRTLASTFLLGVVNGFLPCGLVYVACAGATASGGVTAGIAYMLAFGAGTIPMMLSIGLAGKLARFGLTRSRRLIPVSLVILGTSLILRGMSLGIPYVSPVLTGQKVHCPACH